MHNIHTLPFGCENKRVMYVSDGEAEAVDELTLNLSNGPCEPLSRTEEPVPQAVGDDNSHRNYGVVQGL